MGVADVIQVTKEALWLVLLLSAPPIIAASAVGLLVAFVQAATQLQEQTFVYSVKFVAIVITLFITASLLGATLYRFSVRMFTVFPTLFK
jgi:type III secretion HrpO family protein